MRVTYLVVALALVLAGCTSLRPKFPLDLADWPSSSSIDQSKDFLRTSVKDIAAAALGKHNQDWQQKELLLGGGILAVAGHAASKVGLLNTGLGLGTVGVAANTFYGPHATALTHLNALSEFRCLSRAAEPLSDSQQMLARGVEDPETLRDVVIAADVLAEAIDEATVRYVKAIVAQTGSAQQLGDFRRFIVEFNEAQENRANAAKASQEAMTMLKAAQAELNNLPIPPATKNRLDLELSKENLLVNDRRQGLTEFIRSKQLSATAMVSSVPFVGLKPTLEACSKGVGTP